MKKDLLECFAKIVQRLLMQHEWPRSFDKPMKRLFTVACSNRVVVIATATAAATAAVAATNNNTFGLQSFASSSVREWLPSKHTTVMLVLDLVQLNKPYQN
jgi:hypothetical protein